MSSKATPPAPEAQKSVDLGPQLNAANALILELQNKLQASEHQAQALQATVAELQDSLRAQQVQAQKHESAGHGTHLSIASAHPAGKHMRAGREWLRAPSVVPKDDFTPEQIKQLKTDGNLVVVEL